MNEIKDIRERAGLSLAVLANLLGISKSMLHLIEQGKRRLSYNQIFKLDAIRKHLEQSAAEKMAKPGRVEFTDTIKLGELHRKKMETHRKLAASFTKALQKLQQAAPVQEEHAALHELIKNLDIPGYVPTKGDEILLEIMELQTTNPATLIAEQELLQDKIDTHLAYAELHQQRWGMYVEMG